MNPRHVVILSAGAALSFGCGDKAPPVAPAPAPLPDAAPVQPQAPSTLPSWDSVPSGHPPGATNPPIPELIVTPEGDCYKRWVSPMSPRGGAHGDRVEACPPEASCGVAVTCPPQAAALLAAYAAGQRNGAEE